MAKQKLKWTDTEEIAFRLIDEYPKLDPLKVRFTDLHKYVTGLSDFSDNPKKSTEHILEGIQMRWYEERQDMEDELGPVEGGTGDEDLDEDDYRDDEDADSGDDLSGEMDDEDVDDDFSDGFQEEEIDDDR